MSILEIPMNIAEELLTKAKRKNPHDSSERNEAIELLRTAIAMGSKNPEHWYRLGYFYRYARDFPAAEAAFSKVIEVTNDDPWIWAYFYRGCSRFAHERYQEAIADFNTAENLELDIGDEFYGPGALEELYLWRANAYEALGH